MWVQQKEYRTLGVALAEARKRSGLSQIELAKRLSKPQSFISNLERGQRRIDVLEFERIALAIGYDPVSLFRDLIRRKPVAGRRG